MNDSAEFLRELCVALEPVLAELGLAITDSESSLAFGNAFVEFGGPRFSLRLALDRDDLLVDVRPARRDEWVPWSRMLKAARSEKPDLPPKASTELLIGLLAAGMRRIDASLHESTRAATLETLAELEHEAERAAQDKWG